MERNEAASMGNTRYDNGKPCKRGHSSVRYTRSGVCVECSRLATEKWQNQYRMSLSSSRAHLVLVSVRVHADDAESIKAAAQALNALRGVPQVVNDMAIGKGRVPGQGEPPRPGEDPDVVFDSEGFPHARWPRPVAPVVAATPADARAVEHRMRAAGVVDDAEPVKPTTASEPRLF